MIPFGVKWPARVTPPDKPREIKIGQWWLYRDSAQYWWPTIPAEVDTITEAYDHIPANICVVSILDIIPAVNDKEVVIDFKSADINFSPYVIGDTGTFHETDFIKGEYFKILHDPNEGLCYGSVTGQLQHHGDDCVKCKRHYPHAIRTSGFICWGCKNGF